jgi:hypothetical protein
VQTVAQQQASIASRVAAEAPPASPAAAACLVCSSVLRRWLTTVTTKQQQRELLGVALCELDSSAASIACPQPSGVRSNALASDTAAPAAWHLMPVRVGRWTSRKKGSADPPTLATLMLGEDPERAAVVYGRLSRDPLYMACGTDDTPQLEVQYARGSTWRSSAACLLALAEAAGTGGAHSMQPPVRSIACASNGTGAPPELTEALQLLTDALAPPLQPVSAAAARKGPASAVPQLGPLLLAYAHLDPGARPAAAPQGRDAPALLPSTVNHERGELAAAYAFALLHMSEASLQQAGPPAPQAAANPGRAGDAHVWHSFTSLVR